MRYKRIIEGDIIILNTGVYQAVPVYIKDPNDINMVCNKCSFVKENIDCPLGEFYCTTTYFKRKKGGL